MRVPYASPQGKAARSASDQDGCLRSKSRVSSAVSKSSLDFPHSGRALQIHHLMTVKVLAYPTPPLSIMSCRCVIFIAIGAPLALSSGFDWIFWPPHPNYVNILCEDRDDLRKTPLVNLARLRKPHRPSYILSLNLSRHETAAPTQRFDSFAPSPCSNMLLLVKANTRPPARE